MSLPFSSSIPANDNKRNTVSIETGKMMRKLIELDIKGGTFKLLVESNILEKRTHAEINHSHQGIGRELFKSFREKVGSVETGASIF